MLASVSLRRRMRLAENGVKAHRPAIESHGSLVRVSILERN
jgi:hypothetical protein